VSSPGGIQVRCHARDYYTNSAHKLQLHAAGQRHEASCLLFMHLRESEALCESPRIYHCALCGASCRAKLQLLQHVRTMKHLQMEQIHQLQRRSEGKDLQTDIGEVFQVISQLEPSGFGDGEQGKAISHASLYYFLSLQSIYYIAVIYIYILQKDKSYRSTVHFFLYFFCGIASIHKPTNANIISYETLLKHFKTLRHVSILSDHHQGALFLAKVMSQYSQFNSY
jgi:hypothetical protein